MMMADEHHLSPDPESEPVPSAPTNGSRRGSHLSQLENVVVRSDAGSEHDHGEKHAKVVKNDTNTANDTAKAEAGAEEDTAKTANTKSKEEGEDSRKNDDSSASEHERMFGWLFSVKKKATYERRTAPLEELGLTEEEIEETKMMSPYSEHKLRRLCAIFLRLDKAKKGYITLDHVMTLPQMKISPFNKHLFNLWSEYQDSDIAFPTFVQMMNVFSKNASKEDKIKFLFKLYDSDKDGSLSKSDVNNALSAVVGEIVDEEVIEKIVEKIFEESDRDADGLIQFPEFREALIESDVDLKVRFLV